MGILTEDGRIDDGGYELVTAWAKDQGLEGFIDASSGDGRAFRERLRRAVSRTPITHEAVRLHLTISIGGALASTDTVSLDDLVDKADGCLYAAKFQG